MDQEINLLSIQERLLQMIQKVHRICGKNNIRYYMIGGTLLGAVRHQNFIPWDDDIDIGVPRDDYERLMYLPVEVWEEEDLSIGCFASDTGYKHKFVKIYDKTSTLIYGEGHEIRGLFVDIFPVDGMCTDTDEQQKHLDDIAYYKKQLWYSYGYSNQDPTYEFRELALEKGSIYWQEKLNECLASMNFDKSPMAGILIGLYGKKEIMDTAIFGQPKLMPFGNTFLYGMERSEEYLTHLFGDYMQMPPEDERVPKHILGQFEYCNLNLPYEQYIAEHIK